MTLGQATFGFVADAFGVKKVYLAYLLITALAIHLFVRAPTFGLLALVAILMGFCGQGHFSGFAILTTRLFLIRFRGFALGLIWNLGRALSAPAPWVVGALSVQHGLGSAFWVSSAALLVTAAIALACPDATSRPRLAHQESSKMAEPTSNGTAGRDVAEKVEAEDNS